MRTHQEQSLSQALVYALDSRPGGLAPAELIDLLLKKGFADQDVLHSIRRMLDRGEIGINSEMLFFLRKQLA